MNSPGVEISRSTRILALWVIVLLALALRVIFFVGLGFNDDSYYLEFAEKIYKGLEFKPPKYVWGIRIGVYLPVVLSWKLFGISEFSTSFIFLLYSTASIFCTYFLGKKLFSTGIGLLAALLMAFFPLDVIYASQIGPDLPFQLFSALSVLFFVKFYQDPERQGLWAMLSGLLLGLAYLFKELVLLIVMCFAFYGLWDALGAKERFGLRVRKGFVVILINRKLLAASLFLLAGFCIVYLSQEVYLQRLTGEWFFAEKARDWTLRNDANRNDDYWMYPKAMLNLTGNRFAWVHEKPLLGVIYPFVFASLLVLVVRKKFSRHDGLVLFWLLSFFLFYQYGLTFIATHFVDNGMRPRHLRFLLPMSIPAALMIARGFDPDDTRIPCVKTVVLVFFLASSLYYIGMDRTFLRNGMAYVKDTAEFISRLEPKPVYIPDHWTLSKIRFFLHYDDKIMERLRVYECSAGDCSDPSWDKGETIHDAYVATYVSPYTYINTRSPNQKVYPSFMATPPTEWKLLTTIENENFGLFSKFKPRIYLVE